MRPLAGILGRTGVGVKRKVRSDHSSFGGATDATWLRAARDSIDLEQLLDEIVGGVAGAFGCSRTAVLLKDDVTNKLEMIALRGFSNFHLKGYRFKVGGEGMVGRASTAKMPYTPDVRGHPYYVVSEATTLSEVDIPLISRGKLIGAFNAQSPSLDAFSSEQTELLCAHTFFQP